MSRQLPYKGLTGPTIHGRWLDEVGPGCLVFAAQVVLLFRRVARSVGDVRWMAIYTFYRQYSCLFSDNIYRKKAIISSVLALGIIE